MDEKTVKNLIEEALKEFYRKHLSFRARKITDTPHDSYGINNSGAGSTPVNSVGTNQLQSNAVTIGKLKYEIASLNFASGDTSKTATITSGSIIIGYYTSAFTSTPVYGELKLEISGTTLTGTRSASPGGSATINYAVILIKT